MNNSLNRSVATAKNGSAGVIAKGLSLLLSFLSRTVFIYFLGKYYLGINSLYTEILNVLSFAELGFGSAMLLFLYKPVAEKNEHITRGLLRFYKRIYTIIAFVVGTVGVLLLPFLKYLVQGAEGISEDDLRLFFVIFLSNTVASYFVTYKISYCNAILKNYIVVWIDFVVNAVTISFQVIVICLSKNYLAYLLTHTACLILGKIVTSVFLNHKFSILKDLDGADLDPAIKASINKEVRSLAIHQFSSVAIHSTDNIIISSLSGLGVAAVGLVSNYTLLINSVLGFVTVVFAAFSFGFGNLYATGTKEQYRKAFMDANFISSWIYGFCAIAFFCLIPPFITLWIGSDYILETAPFVLIVLNVYLQGQSTIYNNARTAAGNFKIDMWVSLAQAIINLAVSIVGAIYLGLLGVYIGTIVSRVFFFIARPLVSFKYCFGVSSRRYFLVSLLYFAIALIAGCLTFAFVYFLLNKEGILFFVLRCVVVTFVPNVVFFLCYFPSKEFKSFIARLKNLLRRKKHV